MEVLRIRNAHQGIPEMLDCIQRIGIERKSRYGDVVKFKEPVSIVYGQPRERVIFWPERDANPFFNLLESIWMLAGRRDVKFVEQFVKRMATFSDDGKKFHAAYGFRWRKHFRRDQLPRIIESLKNNLDCRRQYLGIWDPKADLGRVGLDLPCNVGATFQVNDDGELDMVVHNRSNDGLMGAMSANSTHFSVLQEYIAQGVDVPVGRYWQVSSNLHIYKKDLEKFKCLAIHAKDPYRTIPRCPYERGEVVITPVVDCDLKTWEEDLHMWMKNPTKVGLRSQFFLRVATPMFIAHKAFKKGQLDLALEIVETQMSENSDWKRAAKEWLERRK